MKKIISILLISCAIFVTLGGGLYYSKVYNTTKVVFIDGNYVTYNSEKALSDSADIILYGSPEGKFEDRKHVDNITDFYTITPFKIINILKKPITLDIKTSDTFNIIEPIGLRQEIDGKKVLKFVDYDVMTDDTKYIVYLKSNGLGGYSVINMNDGKFDMLKDDSNEEKHKNIKNDVIKIYKSKIKGSPLN